jgi:hypothetical protein
MARKVSTAVSASGFAVPCAKRAVAVEAEIDRVRSLGFDELRALWRRTFRSSPPSAFTKDLVARFICWHLQEQAFGGLDPNQVVLSLYRALPVSSAAQVAR